MSDPVPSLPHYDGPLDLLLEIVRHEHLSIRDLPMAHLTRQYLDYLRTADQLDLNLSAEWLFVAATLIHIKSAQILKQLRKEIDGAPADSIDPRTPLVQELLSHEALTGVAGYLREQLLVEGGTYARPRPLELPEPAAPADEDETDPGRISRLEICEMICDALQVARSLPDLPLPGREAQMQRMIEWLRQRLKTHQTPRPLPASSVFSQLKQPTSQVPLFLAMLEMTKAGEIGLEQAGDGEPLYLIPALS
jgi:segregation and condensation protein A